MDTEITVTVEGKTPLLLHRFTDADQMAASSGTRASSVGDKGTPREQAEQSLYIGADGKTLIVPGPNVFRGLIDAGKFFKNGKSKVTTQKSSLIPACVEMDAIEIPIKHKDPWTVDSRPVRIPSTGGRILRHRPCFNDWSLSFSLGLDTSQMTESLLRDIVDACGSRIGLGDFRPDCKGPFGKFVVTNWKASKNGK